MAARGNVELTRTMNLDATRALDVTNNFVLSLPGYMHLKPTDYSLPDNKKIGQGGSAVIFQGVLRDELREQLGFSDVAVKFFKDSFSAEGIKFEIALLSGLQNKSPHIMQLVGYTDVPELTIVTKFYVNGSLSARIKDPEFMYDASFVKKISTGIAAGMVCGWPLKFLQSLKALGAHSLVQRGAL